MLTSAESAGLRKQSEWTRPRVAVLVRRGCPRTGLRLCNVSAFYLNVVEMVKAGARKEPVAEDGRCAREASLPCVDADVGGVLAECK